MEERRGLLDRNCNTVLGVAFAEHVWRSRAQVPAALVFGRSWAHVSPLGCIFGCLGEVLGALGSSGGGLGGSWELLGWS